MTNQQFGRLLNDRLRAIEETLAIKAVEYATDADRLHNFKRAAAMLGQTPAQACVGFMAKHLVSVADLVAKDAAGDGVAPAMIDEKIGDAINYLVLLEAILKEREVARG